LSYYPDLYVESWFNHTKIYITLIVSTVKNLKARSSLFSPFRFNHYLLATCCVSKQSKGPSLDTFHNPIWNPEAKSKAAWQIAKPQSLYSSRGERNPDNKHKANRRFDLWLPWKVFISNLPQINKVNLSPETLDEIAFDFTRYTLLSKYLF